MRKRITFAGVAVAVLLGVLLGAAPARTQSAAPDASARDELDLAFANLDEEFNAAWTAYQAVLREHAAAKSEDPKRLDAPPSPEKDFFPRYAQLAEKGHSRALRWCLRHARASGMNGPELVESRSRWYTRFFTEHVETTALSEVLRQLRTDAAGAAGGALSVERAIGLCELAFERASTPERRAAILLTQAQILETGDRDFVPAGGPKISERAFDLYRRIVKEFPETEPGQRAAGQLFKLEKLQIGMTAPDFATTDVDGVAFHLADYRGKVVVLDFWGFW